jgi:transposase
VRQAVKKMVEIGEIIDLYKKYQSNSRVARELGISRNTVRKYRKRVDRVQAGEVEEILPKNRHIAQPTRVMTDEIKRKIHRYLESNQKKPKKQRLTIKRVWQLLVRDGHSIGYTTVKEEAARWRSMNGPREVYIMQETDRGYRAEFDWADIQLEIGGTWSKYFLGSMVLTHSLYRFGRIYSRESQQEVIQAHIEFMQEVGGVPQNIYYDQLRAVYDSRTKRFNERFLAFSMHFGFSPCVCNPASPHEKGTDEESIGHIKRIAFGEKDSFSSLEEANAWLNECLADINTHPVYRRALVPAEGLLEEKASFKPLPALEYNNYELRRAKISPYSMVKCDTNSYSVPDTYHPRYITIRVSTDQIELLDGETIIATHRRLIGKNQFSFQISHYTKTFHRKPGAIRHSKALAQVEDTIQNLFNQYFKYDPKGFLPFLDIVRETSESTLSEAIRLLNERGIPLTPDTLRFFIYQQAFQVVEPLNLESHFTVDEPDLEHFDRLMGGSDDALS